MHTCVNLSAISKLASIGFAPIFILLSLLALASRRYKHNPCFTKTLEMPEQGLALVVIICGIIDAA